MKKLLFLIIILINASLFAQVENRATLTYGYFAPTKNNDIDCFNQSNIEFGYNMKSKMIAKKVKWDNNFAFHVITKFNI